MQTSIQTFQSTEFGNIRTLEIDGEPYFVGKDVATALGYTNPQKAIRDHVDDEDKTVNDSFTVNGTQPILINESGLYSLILSSKLKGAKRFKRWVTSEVLPSIRKTGLYAVNSTAAEIKMHELRIKEMNARARLLNAETRRLTLLGKAKGVSQIAIDTMVVKAAEEVTGKDLDEYLPQTEKTYSASEVGNALGISANKVGKLANAYGLKTEEYGVFVLDKSRYSSKEVTTFRYNEKDKQRKSTCFRRRAVTRCIPTTSIKRHFFLIGSGSNGKSVFLSVLSKIFGQENITNVEMSALAQDFQRVQLSSSILNISTETRSDVNGAESYFKQIVAGDMVSACYKGKPYFSFAPRAKMWIACNEYIKPKDTSDGFLRRLKFINFPIKFCDNPQADNERPIDREIEERLTTPGNLSGIFNWMLEGYVALKQNGRFSEPDDERAIKEEFKELINPVVVFIKEYQLPEPTYSVNNTVLFNDYKQWCEDNGHHSLSKRKLLIQISKHLKEYRKDIVPYHRNNERSYKASDELH